MTPVRSAAAGAALWLVLAVCAATTVVHLGLVDVLFLLAPLVAVPLGIELLVEAAPPLVAQSGLGPMLQAARIMQPGAALAVVISMLLPTGWQAAALVTPWLLLAALAGLSGLQLLVAERSLRPSVFVPAAAMGYLAVGAGWLVVSRAGLRLGGFSPAIVELTAVHFHFAGFAATLMAARTLSALTGRHRAGQIAAAGAYLMVGGTSIVAIAIAFALQPPALVGAALLASGVILVAAVTVISVVPRAPRIARLLLTTSAISVFLPMILAVLYTARPVLGTPALSLQDMAATHGVLNSLAFSVLGLVGWRLVTAGSGRLRAEG
jgi:hypothetical protein